MLVVADTSAAEDGATHLGKPFPLCLHMGPKLLLDHQGGYGRMITRERLGARHNRGHLHDSLVPSSHLSSDATW